MDAAVCNFLRTGDKAIVIRGGKFGERWGKICQAYGIECVFIDVEWGKGVDPKAVAEALDENPGVRAVYATASRDVDGDQARRRGDRQGGEGEGRRHHLRRRDHRRRRLRRAGRRVGPGRRGGRLAEGADAAARPGRGGGLRQGLEGERAREPAALLPGPAARAEEPGEGRDRVHAGGVAGRRAARVAAHAEGRDAGGRVAPARAPGQGDARGVGRARAGAVLVVAGRTR